MSLSLPCVAEQQVEGGEDVSTEKMRKQKKARAAALHVKHSVPLSFLRDAIKAAQYDHSFGLTEIGESFGLDQEAYARQCYEDVVQRICGVRHKNKENQSQMFVLRGSSGVGKSTFLAYALVRLRAFFKGKKVILCHAPKAGRTSQDISVCEAWENGELLVTGIFRENEVLKKINSFVSSTGLIVMDGCAIPLQFTGFRGMILMAASPSLYIRDLKDEIECCKLYTIPALSENEAHGIGELIGVGREVVEDNFEHAGGIARYLFVPGRAKEKVEEAVLEVDAGSITKMVSMQVLSRGTEKLMVHSLVLWKVNDYEDIPGFELVSRYAERLVAIKLSKEDTEELKSARKRMAPLSGAEGYAGALFEAYAIRTLQAGGMFSVRGLANNTTISLDVPALGDPVVFGTNKLSKEKAPPSDVRVEDGQGGFKACLLCPTTTDFPTFDCFYFHVDGAVYALQMTIAEVHGLKNSGADNAKKYFDQILGRQKPTTYPAVFVVPKGKESGYVAQEFKGPGKDMSSCFDQYVIGL